MLRTLTIIFVFQTAVWCHKVSVKVVDDNIEVIFGDVPKEENEEGELVDADDHTLKYYRVTEADVYSLQPGYKYVFYNARCEDMDLFEDMDVEGEEFVFFSTAVSGDAELLNFTLQPVAPQDADLNFLAIKIQYLQEKKLRIKIESKSINDNDPVILFKAGTEDQPEQGKNKLNFEYRGEETPVELTQVETQELTNTDKKIPKLFMSSTTYEPLDQPIDLKQSGFKLNLFNDQELTVETGTSRTFLIKTEAKEMIYYIGADFILIQEIVERLI